MDFNLILLCELYAFYYTKLKLEIVNLKGND